MLIKNLLNKYISSRRRPLLNSRISALKREPALFWHSCLYISFWISLAFFPAGYGFREVMPPLCMIFLLLYYRYGWNGSVLAGLKIFWLFPCLWLMILIGVIFSSNPWASLLHAGTGLNKAFILPFIAMECARNEKELKGLVWALVFACFWQGLDGLWQAFTGMDFIMDYKPNAGRLTGSLGDYTVGNYLALALAPAFGVWFILRQKFSAPVCFLLATSLFWPAFFLFQGASSRSGALALASVFILWALLSRGWRNFRLPLWPAAAILLTFAICQPGRLSLERILQDERWDLWRLGWKVFVQNPWFGAGAGQYNSAFHALGLLPLREDPGISHPHNLYLDMLYAHGIIGFGLGAVFIFGFLYWGWNKIKPRLRKEIACGYKNVYWRLTAFFWLGYAAWLVNGIFGHDFYRIWWLAEAMCSLGIMIGAAASGVRARDQ